VLQVVMDLYPYLPSNWVTNKGKIVITETLANRKVINRLLVTYTTHYKSA